MKHLYYKYSLMICCRFQNKVKECSE